MRVAIGLRATTVANGLVAATYQSPWAVQPEVTVDSTLYTAGGSDGRRQGNRVAVTPRPDDEDDEHRLNRLRFQDAPGNETGSGCCCKATGIYVRVVDLECTKPDSAHPEGILSAEIVAMYNWTTLIQEGANECKMEWWEWASYQAGRLNDDGSFTPKLASDGKPLNEAKKWGEAGSRDRTTNPVTGDQRMGATEGMPPWCPARDYLVRQRKTKCPGRGRYQVTDDVRTALPFTLYQYYRQRSGCDDGVNIVQVMLSCDASCNCVSDPMAITQFDEIADPDHRKDRAATERRRPGDKMSKKDGEPWPDPPGGQDKPVPQRPPKYWEKSEPAAGRPSEGWRRS